MQYNKTIIGIWLFLLPVLSFSQGIQFETGSFQEALEKTSKENKILFIDGYADWCAPCKKMENTVFKEKQVGDYFDKNLIAIKVDVEKGEGPRIKEKYGIEGLPGYVFIDGNDEVVYRFSAAMPTDEFMKEVKSAVAYAKDPNSLGRLKERYRKNKKDEELTGLYLEKLHLQTPNANYTDVLENYLNIQKSIPDSSKAMVVLLANHHNQIIFGGEANRIINENIDTEAWKEHVRKDIRAIYQKIPRKMVGTTTEYAIQKKDTTFLELALKNAGNVGFRVDNAQKKKTYAYYYLQTGKGEKYKNLVYDDLKNYMESIDRQQLRESHIEWLAGVEAQDPEALRIVRPNSVIKSEQIYNMLKDYAPFVNTEEEKEEVLSWMETAYYIWPDSAKSTNNFAKIMYLVGDREKAIELQEKAYKLGKQEKMKRLSVIQNNLELMKLGKEISL